MKKLPWFRMYTDFLNDPKIISIAFEDQRHFIAILALKSEGVLDQDCSSRILDRIVAQKLWLEYSTISDVKKRLFDAKLIDDEWQPLSWNKRQFKSDFDPSGATRQKRFKQKQQDSNGNASGNARVTLPDTDTDTDTDKNKPLKKLKEKKNEVLPTQNLVPDETWESFLDVRKKVKAVNSARAIKCLITELEKLKSQGHDPCDVINQSIRSSWKDVYPLKNNESSNGQTKKFDPVAYVNRNRIRNEDEKPDPRIVSNQ